MISSYALRIVTLDRSFRFISTTIGNYTSAQELKKRRSNEIGVISSKRKKSRSRAHAVRNTHTFTRYINGTQINPYGSIYSVNGRCNGSSGQHAKPYSIARRNCPVTASVVSVPPRLDTCIRTLCLQSILDLTQVLWPSVLTYSWKSLVTSDMNTRKRYFPSLSLIKKIENKLRISIYIFFPKLRLCSDIYLFSSCKVKSINKNLIDS